MRALTLCGLVVVIIHSFFNYLYLCPPPLPPFVSQVTVNSQLQQTIAVGADGTKAAPALPKGKLNEEATMVVSPWSMAIASFGCSPTLCP
jgi:hypothetical protein